jgi:CDP-diglyceride synthetase
MNAASLPVRVFYALIAIPAGGAVGFYSSMLLLPKLVTVFPQLDSDGEGFGVFKLAICVGAALAFTMSLLALTMPWKRHRKRHGRAGRIGVTCALVVVTSAGLSVEGVSLLLDLGFAVWLAYTMAYTFARYGVVDQARRRSHSSSATDEFV